MTEAPKKNDCVHATGVDRCLLDQGRICESPGLCNNYQVPKTVRPEPVPDTWCVPSFTPTPPGCKPDFPVPFDEYPRLPVGTIIIAGDMVFKVAAVKEGGGMIACHLCGMTSTWVKRMRKRYGTKALRAAEMARRRRQERNKP